MIEIENKKIGPGNPVFIIAEAGVNHNGNMDLAMQLIDEAVKIGADAIKFQNFITEEIIRIDAPKAAYQDRNIGKNKTQYEMLKELEIDERKTKMLKKYCEKKGTIFISTPYDFSSFEMLKRLNVDIYKLASIDIVFHPLIKKIAETGKPLMLSTGMTTEKELVEAVDVFNENGNIDNLILLQCNTNYPANPEDQNLLAMQQYKKFTSVIGFSDHTQGCESSIAAVSLGANVIERHFTLDNDLSGPDHKASLNPKDFGQFISLVRKTEKILGKSIIKPYGGELDNMKNMRRSICAKMDISQGSIIKKEMLTYKRPGNGLSPTFENINKIIGRRAKRNINRDENISLNMVE